MAYYPSNNSGIDMNGPTYFQAFEDRMTARKAIYEDKLSRCFKVSVEGHDTSLHVTDIIAVYSLHFRSCGGIFDVVIPIDPASGVVERCGFIYFLDEGAQEKALALSGRNVGFPLRGRNERFLGYDTSCPEDVIRSALFSLFSPCGEVIYVSLKDDPDQPGLLQSTGCVCLAGEEARNKAIGLDGTDMGGWNVAVTTLDPNPKPVYTHIDANVPGGWEGPPGYRWRDIHPSTTLH